MSSLITNVSLSAFALLLLVSLCSKRDCKHLWATGLFILIIGLLVRLYVLPVISSAFGG